MWAAQVPALGGPEVLRVADLPTPAPGPGTLLVRVEATGVGPWDTKMRSGAFGPQPTPYVPGAELAGTVTAVGPGVESFAVGDAVWAHPALTGCCAELVVVPAASVGRRPATLAAVDAGGVPVGLLTADEALDRLELAAGERVLVLAAGGNVGAFAVQLAITRGATVIAQAGAADHDRLRTFGAVVVDARADWTGQTRAAAPHGVDALLDPLGGDALVAALAFVRDGGRAMSLLPGRLPDAPRGIALANMSVMPDGARLTRLAALFDRGALHAQTGPTFPLDQVAEAHRAYERGVKGKVVVRVR